MTDFLIAYYAMGWAFAGIAFAGADRDYKLLAGILWPISLLIYSVDVISKASDKQYLWRKPK